MSDHFRSQDPSALPVFVDPYEHLPRRRLVVVNENNEIMRAAGASDVERAIDEMEPAEREELLGELCLGPEEPNDDDPPPEVVVPSVTFADSVLPRNLDDGGRMVVSSMEQRGGEVFPGWLQISLWRPSPQGLKQKSRVYRRDDAPTEGAGVPDWAKQSVRRKVENGEVMAELVREVRTIVAPAVGGRTGDLPGAVRGLVDAADQGAEDAAALTELRAAIDEHLGWTSTADEEEGDYVRRVREVGQWLKSDNETRRQAASEIERFLPDATTLSDGQRQRERIAALEQANQNEFLTRMKAESQAAHFAQRVLVAEAEAATLKRELAEAERKLALVSTGIENVWMWQGDGGDGTYSLACPVVMSAGTLRDLVERAEKAELERDRQREARDEYREEMDKYHDLLRETGKVLARATGLGAVAPKNVPHHVESLVVDRDTARTDVERARRIVSAAESVVKRCTDIKLFDQRGERYEGIENYLVALRRTVEEYQKGSR